MQSHRIRRIFDPVEDNTQLVATIDTSHAAFQAARAQPEKSRRDFFDYHQNRELRSLMAQNRATFL